MSQYRSSSRVSTGWRHLSFLILAAILFIYPTHFALAADKGEEEVKMGTEAANKFAADKTTKFVTDPASVARVEAIGQAIADVANEKVIPAKYGKSEIYKFKYAFKIVDDKDINAFSLPGGFVYVNKALLDYTQSDDELAGVIAHEIAHIAHHHITALMAEENKQMAGMAAVLVAGAIGGVKGDNLFKLLQVGGLISVAKSSAYGQKAELDADRAAVTLLAETKKYNPVGILTFMERMARDEVRKPGINYGIYQNHPPSQLRAHEIVDEMDRLNLPINRRLVTTYTQVQVKPVEKSAAWAVWVSETEIIRLADSGGLKASIRAESVASELRNALISGARYHDVKLDDLGQSVVVFGETAITPTQEDAALAGTTTAELTKSAALHIKQALLRELLNQGF